MRSRPAWAGLRPKGACSGPWTTGYSLSPGHRGRAGQHRLRWPGSEVASFEKKGLVGRTPWLCFYRGQSLAAHTCPGSARGSGADLCGGGGSLPTPHKRVGALSVPLQGAPGPKGLRHMLGGSMARGRQQQWGAFLMGKSTDSWGHSQRGRPGHLCREQPPPSLAHGHRGHLLQVVLRCARGLVRPVRLVRDGRAIGLQGGLLVIAKEGLHDNGLWTKGCVVQSQVGGAAGPGLFLALPSPPPYPQHTPVSLPAALESAGRPTSGQGVLLEVGLGPARGRPPSWGGGGVLCGFQHCGPECPLYTRHDTGPTGSAGPAFGTWPLV